MERQLVVQSYFHLVCFALAKSPIKLLLRASPRSTENHHFSPSMITGPSLQLPSGFSGNWFSGGASKAHSTMGLQHSNEDRAELSGNCTSQLAQGNSAWIRLQTANDYVAFNAEI